MTDSVLTETHGRVGLIRFNRPEAMNALNADVVAALAAAIDDFEANPDIGCLVLTGSDTVFAAGADIGFMKDFSYLHAYRTDFVTTGGWEVLPSEARSVFAGEALRCDFGGRLLAGFMLEGDRRAAGPAQLDSRTIEPGAAGGRE